MKNLIMGISMFVIVLIWISFICKHIENKELKKQIKILCLLLLLWLVTRIIKYSFVKDADIAILLWYSYYFPILFSSIIFLNISTWNNRNKKNIKILKLVSVIISSILFLLVMTNNFHSLVFKINTEASYTYGIVYYLCFIFMFLILSFSIISAVRGSKGLYKKQKFTILTIILLLVFIYATSYMNKMPFIFKYFNDFTIIYIYIFIYLRLL